MPRVLFALLVPSLGLVVASSIIVAEKRTTVSEMQKLSSFADLATHISALVHEMQKERGTSAVFLGSKGEQLQRELPEQRQLTDAQRQHLGTVLKTFDARSAGSELAATLDDAVARLTHLDGLRQDISALKLPMSDSYGYFTATIGRLLDVVAEISQLAPNADVARALSAYSSFVQAKECSGQERATGAAGFIAGKFSLAQYQLFVGLVASESTYLRLFRSYATAEDQTFLAATVAGEAISEVERMRKLAVETPPGEMLGGTDGVRWFKMNTARIDLMKTVEDHLAGNLLALAEHTRATAESSFWTALGIAGSLVALTGMLGFVIVRSITRPIGGMTVAMHNLAGGDSATEIPARERGDEIGVMAQALQVFKDNMIESERLRAEQEEIKRRAEDEKRAFLNAVADDFQASIKGVVDAVSSASVELQRAARSMSVTADRTNQQAAAVAAASEQASANVQTVAASTEEMASSIAEISRQVEQSTHIARKAVDEAQHTTGTMESLADAAQKIGEVIQLIQDIASQTNLLALNATIEAARAGDAGKGFAVVASEVKSLATQTGKATEEIGAQITAIQAATGQAVSAIRSIDGTIGEISEISTTIAAAMEEQGAATREITRNTQEAARGTQDVSTNIGGVNQAASETGAAAAQVLGSAGELEKQAESLRTGVDDFLAKIRAA